MRISDCSSDVCSSDLVAAVPPQPAGDRPGAAAGVQDHAVDDDVHHGALRRRAAGLLDHQQLPVDRAAAVDVPQVPAAQGGPGEVTDAAPDDDHAERARKLFAGPIAFLKSAPALQHLPAPTVPEIAFAGRSNVGKSSLLNALTHRNGLARPSVTPGRSEEHTSELQSL